MAGTKKKTAAAAAAVALAVALTVGGTLSYLSDTSGTVENDFNPNGNAVSIAEAGAEADEDGTLTQSFAIVPGISDSKDPEVTVTYTIDSYVFLLVDDNTVYDDVSYVDYAIDSAWTLLYEADDAENPYSGYDVYYMLVTTSDEDETDTYTATYNVISGETVSYSSSLTNEDMEALGDNEVTLSFQALIIQAKPFDTDQEADATSAANALLGYTGDLGMASSAYDSEDESGSATTLKVSVNTGAASTDGSPSTSTTFTVTVPGDTELTATDSDGNDSEIESLTLIVTEVSAETGEDLTGESTFTIGSYTYDISLVDQDGNAVSASEGLIQVDIQLAAGLSGVTVYHGDTAMSDTESEDGYYSYNATTGVLSIYTKSFSEYKITWGIAEAASVSELASALSDSDISYVELTDDVEVTYSSATYISSDKTLDLGGNDLTLTSGNYYGFYVYNDADLTIIGDGTITSYYSAIYAGQGTVSLGEDGSEITITTTASNDGLAWLLNDSTMVVGENVSLVQSGGYGGVYLYGTAGLDLYGSISVCGYTAIYTSGESTTTTESVVNIYDGASVTNTDNVAIYQASGTYNIYGGTITGQTGIYTRSGNLTISGENVVIKATKEEYYEKLDTTSAAYNTGDALIIDNCGYPMGDPVVSISAGSFSATADGASAVLSTYTGDYSAITGFLSGGTYSTQPADSYLADGYSVQENTDGTYSVVAQ